MSKRERAWIAYEKAVAQIEVSYRESLLKAALDLAEALAKEEET